MLGVVEVKKVVLSVLVKSLVKFSVGFDNMIFERWY